MEVDINTSIYMQFAFLTVPCTVFLCSTYDSPNVIKRGWSSNEWLEKIEKSIIRRGRLFGTLEYIQLNK